jgi:hypothetical protein
MPSDFSNDKSNGSRILTDATQIGIEVTVPSDKSLNPKGRVCKDLVLWREPSLTNTFDIRRVQDDLGQQAQFFVFNVSQAPF